jgi:lipoteichoic acid synthase
MKFLSTLNKKTHLIEFLLMIFVVFTFDIIFVIRYGFNLSFKHWMVAFFNAGIIVSLLLLIKQNKRRFIAYIIFVLIMFTFFVTDSTLYYFKKDVTSIAMLLESGKNTMRIGLKYNPLMAYNIFIWIAILGFLFYFFKILNRVLKVEREYPVKKFFSRTFYLLFSILGLVFSPMVIDQGDKLLFQTPSDKALFVQKFGSISYHMRDIFTFTGNALKPIFYRDTLIEDINDRVTDEKAPLSPYFGQFQNKNVIMIMCETCEEYGFTREYTPNYYRLVDQSLYYRQFYSAAKSNYTYDAEFKALTSMMYFQADNFMYTFGTNQYPQALPNMLKNQGYTALSFHNFYGDFFNRNIIHQSIGFERFYALEDLNVVPGDYWTLDSLMFDQFKDLIVPIQDQPFFSFIITVTPHGPHNKHRNELQEYYNLLDQDPNYVNESLEFRTITAAQMDFDKGLGMLLDDLEEKNLMDDTIIILFSDHKNYSSQLITLEKTPNSNLPFEIEKVPFVIYIPGFESMTIDLISSHYDIAPTIMDLLGIEYYKDLYYGQSIFLEEREDRPIILSYSSWICINEMVEFDMVVSGEISVEDFLVKKQMIYDTIDFFEKLFFSNYFKYPNQFYDVVEETS